MEINSVFVPENNRNSPTSQSQRKTSLKTKMMKVKNYLILEVEIVNSS